MQIMGRRAEGRPAIADYTVWTNELSREELMIILEGQRVHRINKLRENCSPFGKLGIKAVDSGIITN